MDDQSIVELYWKRSETAISETAVKYGGYCYHIAYNILTNREDAEESVSDTYLAAWNTIPPRRPGLLSTYLGKLTRHLSIDRWRQLSAAKRGGGEVALALDELSECIAGGGSPEESLNRKVLCRVLNAFLEQLPETERRLFLRRYWYLDSTGEMAQRFGFSESKVKSMLHRIRGRLKRELEKEGLT